MMKELEALTYAGHLLLRRSANTRGQTFPPSEIRHYGELDIDSLASATLAF